mmetsp:Transcript_90147/g.254221  ORF Transcript_90147/g.254221 Transcript_90147/m.254221 type:complete len:246 (-) Transcript_90147:245-982(-)
MATKLTQLSSPSFCFLFCKAFFAAFFALWTRFALLAVFLAPMMPLAASFASSSSSFSSSLSFKIPSKPLVLLPRNKCARAAATFRSGCMSPALIRFTTRASFQMLCLFIETKTAHARRAMSASPSFSFAKKKSTSSFVFFWFRQAVLSCTRSLTMCLKIISRSRLSFNLNSLKYNGRAWMHGNWSRFLSKMSACTSVDRIIGCMTSSCSLSALMMAVGSAAACAGKQGATCARNMTCSLKLLCGF